MNSRIAQGFDGHAYDELTRFISARVKYLREYRKFLEDASTRQYTQVRFTIKLKEITVQHEIRTLLEMRRILKKSALDRWDTKFFKMQDEIIEKLTK